MGHEGRKEGKEGRESLDRKYVPHFYVRAPTGEGGGSFLNLCTLFWAPEMVNGGGATNEDGNTTMAVKEISLDLGKIWIPIPLTHILTRCMPAS